MPTTPGSTLPLVLAFLASQSAAVPSVPPAPSANALALQHRIAAAASSGVPATIVVARGTYVFSNHTLLIANAANLVLQAARVPAVPRRCLAAVRGLCGGAAGPAEPESQCVVCAGQQQRALRKAGCSSKDIGVACQGESAVATPAVTFVFYYGFGVQIVNSANVTVRGPLALDSEPPNYAQGIVRVVGGEGGNSSTFEGDFDEHFLPPDTSVQPFSHSGGLAGAKVSFWDAETRRLSISQPHLGLMAASQPLGGGGSNRWRIVLKAPTPPTAHPGALVTVFPRRGVTHDVRNSSGVLVEDVSIYAGGNMGFHESLGEGGHVYRRVRIVRKPGWSGLMALNADGFRECPPLCIN